MRTKAGIGRSKLGEMKGGRHDQAFFDGSAKSARGKVMRAQYTPKELELLVRCELQKYHKLPRGLQIQIVRTPKGWRAACKFLPPDLPAAEMNNIVSRLSRISAELAAHHDVVGG
jgi:hypothetical protein